MNVKRLAMVVAPVALVAAAGAFFAGRAAAPSGDGPPAAETPRPIAWLREATGSVLVGGTAGGATASSRTPMRARDQLATENASRAIVDLRASGTVVVGAKAALQILGEEWDGPQLKPTRARFLRGTMRAEASDGVAGMLIEAGDHSVEIAPNGTVFFTWDGAALALSMLKQGGVLHDADGKETVLTAGQGVRLEPNRPVAAVALPGPVAGKTRVRETLYAKGGKARPTFRFDNEPGKVSVVVARDEKLTDVVAEAADEGGAVRVDEGLAPGSYFWSAARVDAVSKLTGPFSAPKAIKILAGEGPSARDEAPASSVIVAGENTRVFYSGDTPPELALDWVGMTDEDSGYTVLVTGGKKTVLKTVAEESRAPLGALPAGSYSWKVKGPDGKSQSGSFLVKRATGGPVRVTRTSRVAEEFDRSTVVFQREPPAIEMTWKADARAAKYRLRVAREKTFAGGDVLTRELATPSTLIEPGVIPEGELYWRVERLKADGGIYYPGKVQMLTVSYDLENPNLELASPAEGAAVVGGSIAVSGLAPRDSAIWVNDVAVAPDRRGRFGVTVNVDALKPQVVVKTARAGKDFSYFVRTLKPATN